MKIKTTDMKQPIPTRHSWFADATLPRLPAPYYWAWQDGDLNIVFNKDNIHKEDGTPLGARDEVVVYIYDNAEIFGIRYLGIGTNMRAMQGMFPDVQTAINMAYARLCMGEWE